MTSAKKRAESTVRMWWEQETNLDLETLVELALKEQDRDTRHACAEAVTTLPPFNKYIDHDGNAWVGLDAAHNACMNVKTV